MTKQYSSHRRDDAASGTQPHTQQVLKRAGTPSTTTCSNKALPQIAEVVGHQILSILFLETKPQNTDSFHLTAITCLSIPDARIGAAWRRCCSCKLGSE